MAYTTITATTIGLADGDTSPSPVDGTIRITPRFPAAATTSGFTVSGPVIVTVAGGEMPETQIPSMEGTTGLVEFHLYDRNAGPVRMPATEIPLDPDSTISLNEFLPVGVDPVSGVVFIKGETGPQGPRGARGPQGEPGIDDITVLKDRINELEGANRSTGLRDITAVIGDHLKESQPGRLYATRIGQLVTLSFDMLQFAESGWSNIGYLPPSLKPFTDHHVSIFWGSSESVFTETSMLIIRGAGSVSFMKYDRGSARTTITYPTKSEWPSTLPGDPA